MKAALLVLCQSEEMYRLDDFGFIYVSLTGFPRSRDLVRSTPSIYHHRSTVCEPPDDRSIYLALHLTLIVRSEFKFTSNIKLVKILNHTEAIVFTILAEYFCIRSCYKKTN